MTDDETSFSEPLSIKSGLLQIPAEGLGEITWEALKLLGRGDPRIQEIHDRIFAGAIEARWAGVAPTWGEWNLSMSMLDKGALSEAGLLLCRLSEAGDPVSAARTRSTSRSSSPTSRPGSSQEGSSARSLPPLPPVAQGQVPSPRRIPEEHPPRPGAPTAGSSAPQAQAVVEGERAVEARRRLAEVLEAAEVTRSSRSTKAPSLQPAEPSMP